MSTLRLNDLQKMISNARKYRATEDEEKDDEFVHISKALFEEIEGVMTQKCKYDSIKFYMKQR